ncbi:MAG: ribbon-helix-helix domain-containing protein [Chloroflexota bacterium]|nr:ribbon-helix-helix domain-containing protein [Chloroflexota bacterium]
MKTIQMTIDLPLLEEVDKTVQILNTNRSAFIRDALQFALRHYYIKEMEKQQAQGYAKYPINAGEFDVWESEQDWGQT